MYNLIELYMTLMIFVGLILYSIIKIEPKKIKYCIYTILLTFIIAFLISDSSQKLFDQSKKINILVKENIQVKRKKEIYKNLYSILSDEEFEKLYKELSLIINNEEFEKPYKELSLNINNEELKKIYMSLSLILNEEKLDKELLLFLKKDDVEKIKKYIKNNTNDYLHIKLKEKFIEEYKKRECKNNCEKLNNIINKIEENLKIDNLINFLVILYMLTILIFVVCFIYFSINRLSNYTDLKKDNLDINFSINELIVFSFFLMFDTILNFIVNSVAIYGDIMKFMGSEIPWIIGATYIIINKLLSKDSNYSKINLFLSDKLCPAKTKISLNKNIHIYLLLISLLIVSFLCYLNYNAKNNLIFLLLCGLFLLNILFIYLSIYREKIFEYEKLIIFLLSCFLILSIFAFYSYENKNDLLYIILFVLDIFTAGLIFLTMFYNKKEKKEYKNDDWENYCA